MPPTEKFILIGDVLEDTEYRLTKQHWRVLSHLRKLADQLELIWVRGNHDYDAQSVAHLIGATFVPEYEFESGGRRMLCVHGDAWDCFLTDHPVITNIADWFYLRMQRWSRRLANRAKRSSKTFVRCVDRVRTEAMEYGKAKRADVFRHVTKTHLCPLLRSFGASPRNFLRAAACGMETESAAARSMLPRNET